MARFFDSTTWELEKKLWLEYLYGINIICSKKLHTNLFITKSRDFKSVFVICSTDIVVVVDDVYRFWH